MEPDELHPTGKCSCFGSGICWWCLWTEEREKVELLESKLQKLVERYVPAGLRAEVLDE